MYKTTLLGATILAVFASGWGICARAQGADGPAAGGLVASAASPLMTTNYLVDNANADIDQPLINTGTFIVGDLAYGNLTIGRGGNATTTPNIGKTGAVIGANAGGNGYVRVTGARNGQTPFFLVNGDLLIGQYGIGELYNYGSTLVQGDLEVGVHGAATGTVVLATGESMTVQGQTRLGIDAGTYARLVARLGEYAQAVSFNYGRQLQVGFHGAATVEIKGTGTMGPSAGDGAGTIIIGSQDPSTNFASGNSIAISNPFYYRGPSYVTKLLGGTMIINSSTHVFPSAQQNLLTVGAGSFVVLSQELVIHDNAYVYLEGGELDVPSITFLGNAQITGYGVVNSPIENGHVAVGGRAPVRVAGGASEALTITGDVSGPNSLLDISRGTLALQGAVGGDVHIDFAPTLYRGDLQLSKPEAMAGLIGNFNSLDNIELLNKLVVTHAYHDHGDGTGALSLTFSDGTFAQLNFAGAYSSTMFHVIADGTTGTRIYVR